MLKSIKTLVIFGSILFSLSALAENTKGSTARLNTQFDRSAGFLSARFTVAADAHTTVTVSHLKREEQDLSFTFAVKVNCSAFDVKGHIFGKAHNIAVGESVCISSTQERSVSVDFSGAEEERTELLKATVFSALSDENGTSPEGFNLDSEFANLAEGMCPGTKAAFKDSVACMAFKDRKEHMTQLITDLVLSVASTAPVAAPAPAAAVTP
jgi:hypothetical protein